MENNNRLSQDEIDALLKGGDDTAQEQPESGLSLMEQDTIGEIGNISFGSSATALSTLLNQKVEITTPTVSVIEKSHLNDEFPHPYVSIGVSYTEGFSGNNLLVIKQEDAAIIADLMMGGDGTNADPSLGEIHLSAVQEAMNQMMGSAATSMSTVFSKKIDISPPEVDLLDVNEGEGTEQIPKEDPLVKVSFRLKVGELIDSHIMQLYPLTFAKDLIDELTNQDGGEEPVQTEEVKQPPVQENPAPSPSPAPAQTQRQEPAPKRQGTAKFQSLCRWHRQSFNPLPLRLTRSRTFKTLTCSWIFLCPSQSSWGGQTAASKRCLNCQPAVSLSLTNSQASLSTSWSTSASLPKAKSSSSMKTLASG